MSNLTIQKENTITGIDTWLKYAEPEGGESQWKEGRSAMEFARYMTASDNLPKEIHDYLNAIGIKDSNYRCSPEHLTTFPPSFGRGGGRHHDGLLISKSAIVGIEAKVSEPFDKSVSVWINSGTGKGSKENRNQRILEFLSLLKDQRLLSVDESAKSLMYQLVSASVGTIIEAVNNGKDKAVVLVIEFTGDIDDNGDHDQYIKDITRNEQDYEYFIKYLGISERTDLDRNIKVEYNSKKITVWYKKLTISVHKGGYSYSNK